MSGYENDTSATAGPDVRWRNSSWDIAAALVRVYRRLDTEGPTAGRLGFTSTRLEAGAAQVHPLDAEAIRTSPAYLPEVGTEQAVPGVDVMSPARAVTAAPSMGRISLGGAAV